MPSAKRASARRLARASAQKNNKQIPKLSDSKGNVLQKPKSEGDDRVNVKTGKINREECADSACHMARIDSKEFAAKVEEEVPAGPPTAIKIEIKLPNGTPVIYAGYSSDIANIVLLTILETSNAYEYTASNLLANGKVIPETSVLPLGDDVEYSLGMREYTEKDAKIHILRIHGLFYGPQRETREVITFPADETPCIHLYNQKCSSESLEEYLLNWKPLSKREIGFANLQLSSWSPPPHRCRIRGEFFYISLKTLSGETVEITACIDGFYCNRSTETVFDSRPKSSTYSTLPKLLAELCPKFAPVYERALESITEESLSRKSCMREPAPASLSAINWMVPESLDDNVHDSLKTFALTSHSQTMLESIVSDVPRDWNEEVQSYRTLYIAARDLYKSHFDRISELHEAEIVKNSQQTVAETIDSAQESVAAETSSEPSQENGIVALDGSEDFDVSIANHNFRQIVESRLQFASTAASGVVAAVHGSLTPLADTYANAEDSIFLYNNILLTKVESNHRRFAQCCPDPMLAARMAAAHENLGLTRIENCRIPDLHTIPAGLVDYCGLRYSAQAVIPGFLCYTPTQKIIYGPCDNYFGEVDISLPPDTKLTFDQETHDLMGQMSEKMYWREHELPRDPKNDNGEKIKFWPSFDTRVLAGLDGRKYVLEVHRVTPFDKTFISSSKEDGFADPYPMAHPPLRPELLDLYSRELKAKDATTNNGQNASSEESAKSSSQTQNEIKSTCLFNPDTFIEGLEQYYTEEDAKNVENLLTYLYSSVIPRFTARFLDNTRMPSNGKMLAGQLHDAGINVRLLGLLTTSAEKVMRLTEAKKFPKFNFLGTLLRRELLIRAFKHVAQQYLAVVAGTPKVAAVVSKLLTTLMQIPGPKINTAHKSSAACATPVAIENLTPEILVALITRDMGKRYRYKPSQEIWRFNRKIVLVTVCNVLGIQLRAKNYTAKFEIAEEDVMNICPMIRTISDTSEICHNSMIRTQMFLPHMSLADSLDSLEQTWALFENSFGHLHPQSMNALYSLVHAMTVITGRVIDQSPETNHTFELIELYTTICERLHGIDSLEAITGHHHMASLCQETGRSELAAYHAEHFLRLIPSRMEYDSPECIPYYDCAASIFSALKRFAEATKIWKIMKDICEPTMRQAPQQFAEICHYLSIGQLKLENYYEAAKNAKIAFEIAVAVLGNKEATTLEYEKHLKKILEMIRVMEENLRKGSQMILSKANAKLIKAEDNGKSKKKVKAKKASTRCEIECNDDNFNLSRDSVSPKSEKTRAIAPASDLTDTRSQMLEKPKKGNRPVCIENERVGTTDVASNKQSKADLKMSTSNIELQNSCNSIQEPTEPARVEYDLSTTIADCVLDDSKPFQVVSKAAKLKIEHSKPNIQIERKKKTRCAVTQADHLNESQGRKINTPRRASDSTAGNIIVDLTGGKSKIIEKASSQGMAKNKNMDSATLVRGVNQKFDVKEKSKITLVNPKEVSAKMPQSTKSDINKQALAQKSTSSQSADESDTCVKSKTMTVRSNKTERGDGNIKVRNSNELTSPHISKRKNRAEQEKPSFKSVLMEQVGEKIDDATESVMISPSEIKIANLESELGRAEDRNLARNRDSLPKDDKTQDYECQFKSIPAQNTIRNELNGAKDEEKVNLQSSIKKLVEKAIIKNSLQLSDENDKRKTPNSGSQNGSNVQRNQEHVSKITLAKAHAQHKNNLSVAKCNCTVGERNGPIAAGIN